MELPRIHRSCLLPRQHIIGNAFQHTFTKSPFTHNWTQAKSAAASYMGNTSSKSYEDRVCKDIIDLGVVEVPLSPLFPRRYPEPPSSTSSREPSRGSFSIQQQVCSYHTSVRLTSSSADTSDLPRGREKTNKWGCFKRCGHLFGYCRYDEDSETSAYEGCCGGVRDKGYRARRNARRKLARATKGKKLRRRAKANAKAGCLKQCFNCMFGLGKNRFVTEDDDDDDDMEMGCGGSLRGKGYMTRKRSRHVTQSQDFTINNASSEDTYYMEEPVLKSFSKPSLKSTLVSSRSRMKVSKIPTETRRSDRLVNASTMTCDERLDKYIANHYEHMDINNFICSLCAKPEHQLISTPQTYTAIDETAMVPNKRKRKYENTFSPSIVTMYAKPSRRTNSTPSRKGSKVFIKNASVATKREPGTTGFGDSVVSDLKTIEIPLKDVCGFEADIEDSSDDEARRTRKITTWKEKWRNSPRLDGIKEEIDKPKEGFISFLKKWLCCCFC